MKQKLSFSLLQELQGVDQNMDSQGAAKLLQYF